MSSPPPDAGALPLAPQCIDSPKPHDEDPCSEDEAMARVKPNYDDTSKELAEESKGLRHLFFKFTECPSASSKSMEHQFLDELGDIQRSSTIIEYLDKKLDPLLKTWFMNVRYGHVWKVVSNAANLNNFKAVLPRLDTVGKTLNVLVGMGTIMSSRAFSAEMGDAKARMDHLKILNIASTESKSTATPDEHKGSDLPAPSSLVLVREHEMPAKLQTTPFGRYNVAAKDLLSLLQGLAQLFRDEVEKKKKRIADDVRGQVENIFRLLKDSGRPEFQYLTFESPEAVRRDPLLAGLDQRFRQSLNSHVTQISAHVKGEQAAANREGRGGDYHSSWVVDILSRRRNFDPDEDNLKENETQDLHALADNQHSAEESKPESLNSGDSPTERHDVRSNPSGPNPEWLGDVLIALAEKVDMRITCPCSFECKEQHTVTTTHISDWEVSAPSQLQSIYQAGLATAQMASLASAATQSVLEGTINLAARLITLGTQSEAQRLMYMRLDKLWDDLVEGAVDFDT